MPAAALGGIIGLFVDKRKWAAGSAAVIAGGLTAFYMTMMMVA